MPALGTLSWLDRTGGKLAWTDRLTLIAQGVRARAETRKRLRARVKHRFREVVDILPPDSAIVRAAYAMSEDASEPYLLNHCLRAYFWARLLDDGARPFDDEAVFVSLLLHDLGLTETHRLRDEKHQCFTVVGARAVERLGARHGWDGQRTRLAAEAIALHLNVVVHDRYGREAWMVRAGSGADVAGIGLDVLHRDQVAAVVARHPRLDLKRRITHCLAIEAEQRPASRIAFMQRRLGFDKLIRSAPYFDA